MDFNLLSALKERLSERFDRVFSSNHETCRYSLIQLRAFINSNPVLECLSKALEHRSELVAQEFETIIHGNPVAFQTEFEYALVAHKILELIADNQIQDLEYLIAQSYSSERGLNEANSVLFAIFFYPLLHYYRDNLTNNLIFLHVLKLFRQKCEWFQRDALSEKVQSCKGAVETVLAKYLYEYLLDQGIVFFIEPRSVSGIIDLIIAQPKGVRILADAKIFSTKDSKGKPYLLKGFRQIYSYAVDFQETNCTLVIFKITDEEIVFNFSRSDSEVPTINLNGKFISFFVIDLFPHSNSASKRGNLKTVTISEQDLKREIENENP